MLSANSEVVKILIVHSSKESFVVCSIFCIIESLVISLIVIAFIPFNSYPMPGFVAAMQFVRESSFSSFGMMGAPTAEVIRSDDARACLPWYTWDRKTFT